MSKTIVKTIIGVVLIGGAMSYFVYQAMQSSWDYYYSVDELAAQNSSAQDHSLRVAGRVQKASIQHDIKQMDLTFKLAGTQSVLAVSYGGVVPDNFAEDVEVVVEGHLTTNGVFQADKLMTKCESKYKAKVE
jgi:cytochrome c-type biogenesis protein CcmE